MSENISVVDTAKHRKVCMRSPFAEEFRHTGGEIFLLAENLETKGVDFLLQHVSCEKKVARISRVCDMEVYLSQNHWGINQVGEGVDYPTYDDILWKVELICSCGASCEYIPHNTPPDVKGVMAEGFGL